MSKADTILVTKSYKPIFPATIAEAYNTVGYNRVLKIH